MSFYVSELCFKIASWEFAVAEKDLEVLGLINKLARNLEFHDICNLSLQKSIIVLFHIFIYLFIFGGGGFSLRGVKSGACFQK